MIKVGICGVGRWATEEHIPRIRETGGFDFISAYDAIPARRIYAQNEYGVKVFSDYKEFLRSGIDLAVITTPSNTHYDLAIEAIKRGLNLVIEKPCTLSFRDSKKIFDLARKKKVIATVYQNRRFDGDYLTVRKVLQENLIGDLFSMESNIVSFGTLYDFSTKDFDQKWRHKKFYGGGQLYDMGSHLVDQMLLLIKKRPISVWCDMKNIIWSKEVDSFFKLILRFEGGVTSKIEISQLSRYGLPRWYILGAKGAVVSDYWGAPFKIKRSAKETEPGEETILEPEQSDWGRFYNNFRDVFEKSAELLVKPEEILRSASIIDAARRSNVEKKEINI